MKKIVKSILPAVYLMVIAFSAASCNKTQAAPAAAPGQPVDLTYAADKALPSVVYIKSVINSKVQTVEYADPFEDFFSDPFGGFFGRGQNGNNGGRKRQVQTPRQAAAGSGVIISADGYIVTNNHVVDGADELTVTLNENSKEYSARIVGADKTTDLALIKIEASGLQAIKVGNSENLKLGEWVLAIGNPFSLTSTVTAGIVSAKARSLGATAGSIESFIQTDAAINPGNSGGALVNARGELVGINAMLYSQTGSFAGYGFAIPTTIMNKVVADLRQYGSVQRALLGVTGTDVSNYIDQQHERGNEVDLGTVNGIYVDEVTVDGGAAQAGIKHGDVITAIDNKKIDKFGELQEALVSHRPGDKVKVTFIRDKKQQTVTVTLRNVQGTTTPLERIDSDAMGAALRPLTADERRELNIPYGLMISAIRDGKLKQAGMTKGLIIMRVNEREMRTNEDFEEAVKAANMSSERVLWIRAKTQTGLNKSFAVELTDPKNKGGK